jgi:F-type H+-transporting ATPase subunit delta
VTAPRVAARYAEGLFRLAQARGTVGEIGRELEVLSTLVERTPELRRLLERPDLPEDRKVAALRQALGEGFSETIHGLLDTLVRHERGDSIELVAAAYGELVDEAAGVVRVSARTVVPLSAEQQARLLRALERLTGKPVKLEEQIDPKVLAGVRLQVGDSLIDGSAAGRLAHMREELLDERG